MVGQGQVASMSAKIEAIAKFPIPEGKKDLMRFLGMVGYHRKFCHHFSSLAEPLTALLKAGVKFVWIAKCQDVFEAIKSMLQSESILMAPDFDKQFKLYVDASDIGLGAVLLQEDVNGQDHPICYFSRKFNCHQRYYCTSEKEALALILSLQHFEVYLSSTAAPVLAFTDHNPLIYLQHMRNHNWKLLRCFKSSS